MEKLLFRSTNHQAPLASFREVLLRGQAPDYGLYVPVSFPVLTPEEMASFSSA
ncbi:MAG TPA: threonine synthase, partial [bacterium]|nr:threonine synthase [bacterium]